MSLPLRLLGDLPFPPTAMESNCHRPSGSDCRLFEALMHVLSSFSLTLSLSPLSSLLSLFLPLSLQVRPALQVAKENRARDVSLEFGHHQSQQLNRRRRKSSYFFAQCLIVVVDFLSGVCRRYFSNPQKNSAALLTSAKLFQVCRAFFPDCQNRQKMDFFV